MRIEPYLSVDGVPFTISEQEVRKRWGPPLKAGRNAIGLTELDYGTVVYRFQDSGRLEEITKAGPALHFGKVAVPFVLLPAFIRAHDPEAFERAAYLVSPRYGLAFVPGSPPWVTALARHCIDAWRAMS